MAMTYADLLQSAKSQVRLITLDELKRRLDAREDYVLVDVREKSRAAAPLNRLAPEMDPARNFGADILPGA